MNGHLIRVLSGVLKEVLLIQVYFTFDHSNLFILHNTCEGITYNSNQEVEHHNNHQNDLDHPKCPDSCDVEGSRVYNVHVVFLSGCFVDADPVVVTWRLQVADRVS